VWLKPLYAGDHVIDRGAWKYSAVAVRQRRTEEFAAVESLIKTNSEDRR
jgi:hypothetical protein